ncbi:MAG: thioredoxin domain-containing protein [Candidatus Saccharimonadales bacterium]
MGNRFIVVIIALLAIFGGVFVLTKHKTAVSTGTVGNAQPTNHIEGDGTKNVTLVEYGDYQCPACGAFYPVLKQVLEKHKTDIYFQFRNFPLTQIHQHALEAARAAEAAAAQNKYWEMHDLLYENQNNWSTVPDPTATFIGYATQLNLDTTKFRQDMQSERVNNIINADAKAGTALGADSTPTFILDGKKIDKNPRSLDEFNKLIDAEIAAKAKK